jgi:hypothetical protein
MSAKEIQINPCRACMQKLSDPDKWSIPAIADCCYSTLANFTGAQSVNDIRDVDNCVECVVSQLPEAYGFDRNECNLDWKAPPIWNQTPHYFPSLLFDGNTPNQALRKCSEACQDNRYPNECMDNCRIDFNSVEGFEKNDSKDKKDQSYDDYQKDNPWAFWIAFTLASITLAFVLVVIIRGVMSPGGATGRSAMRGRKRR